MRQRSSAICAKICDFFDFLARKSQVTAPFSIFGADDYRKRGSYLRLLRKIKDFARIDKSIRIDYDRAETCRSKLFSGALFDSMDGRAGPRGLI